jgi:hypothetical protein
MTLTIVETRAITGGVDTHADVHVAAALDPIGGLLGVEEFPATAVRAGGMDRGERGGGARSARGGKRRLFWGVTRQRFHELRNSKRFPPPLAELGNGPVWSGSAVRGFLARWVEAAWPAPGRNRSLRRRRRHHTSPHRDRRRAHRHSLGARPARCDRTRARVDSPARPDLLTPGRDQWPRHLPGATLGMGAAHHRRRNTQSRSHPLTPTLPTVRHAHAGPRLFRIGVLGLCGRKLALSRGLSAQRLCLTSGGDVP